MKFLPTDDDKGKKTATTSDGEPRMLTEGFLQARTDRIIALARLAVALFAAVAVWLDPELPISRPSETYAVLFAYVAFSAATLATSRRRAPVPGKFALLSHLFDIGVFTFLVFSTAGPTSPFFLLFTFSIVSATFRWRWRGALWTSVAVLALLLTSAAVYLQLAPGLAFEVDRFLIRCAHVLVIGAMMVYFGFHQEFMADEIARLTAWQPDPLTADHPQQFLMRCAGHAAEVFNARRIVLVLNDPEEPWATVGRWEDGAYQHEHLDAEEFAGMVPEALSATTFMQDARHEQVLILCDAGRVRPWPGEPIAPELRRAFGIGQVLSAPVQSERASGRIFVLDPPDLSVENLSFAALVGGQIAAGLDRMATIQALRRSTATEERLQLARDLHDGFLQSLSGTALQLESLANLVEREPTAALARIRTLQDWLLGEQRELRGLVQRLQPDYLAAAVQELTDPGLGPLTVSLGQQWGLTFETASEPADLKIPADLRFQIQQIVREAAANAARHGGASRLSVTVAQNAGGLRLTIADNGSGLPQHGRFGHEECARQGMGPRSLRERVVSLGGTVIFDSSPQGLVADICLPASRSR